MKDETQSSLYERRGHVNKALAGCSDSERSHSQVHLLNTNTLVCQTDADCLMQQLREQLHREEI